MIKSNKKSKIAIDKTNNLCYNDIMKNKGNKMFTVKKELRFNGVHNRYLVERLQGVQYSIHVSYTKLNVGDKLNVISPNANSNDKKYLLKKYK